MTLIGTETPAVAHLDPAAARLAQRSAVRSLRLGTVVLVIMAIVAVFARPLVVFVPLLVLAVAAWGLNLVTLRATRELTATAWLFGVEREGLRLADVRSPGGQVLVPWAEITSVRARRSGSVLALRLTPAAAARFTGRDAVRRWSLSRFAVGVPMGMTSMSAGYALAAIESRAPGLTNPH